MPKNPRVILSAFADEAASTKSAVEQLAVTAALGLSYYSPRFIDVDGTGAIQHVTELDESQLQRLLHLQRDYGVGVASIGSRLGKVKLLDVDDGSRDVYVPPDQYLNTTVAATIRAAHALGARLVRGFSFYHPRGEDPARYISLAADRLRPMVDACSQAGLVYGLELEANLVGQNGRMVAALAKAVDHPRLVGIFDGGNIASQNFPAKVCHGEFRAMLDCLGWLHIKDYRIDPKLMWTGMVDEERLKNFVPCDEGDSGHELIFRDLKKSLPAVDAKMKELGVPGVFLELEPHLKGGGQFGGFSGPDGMGVALRALCRMLDQVPIEYHLRDFSDLGSTEDGKDNSRSRSA
jgi:sugar phosphate isomerase/epimerase